jgi:uncharacterized protein (DUF2336 family)
VTASARQRGLGDVAQRQALAASRGTSPEMLTFLAADPAPEVRAAVAANRATPPQAGLLLADDEDAAVRSALARRVATLAPGLARDAQDRLARFTAATLSRLVEDAEVEVRAALSDAVAGLEEAPRELILRLARDTELPVAAPVLRLSPLLTDADLVALVQAPPAAFTRRSVAERRGLSEPVAEAVAETEDAPAIAVLLANPSAAIREETLDRLAAGAAGEPDWQAALVRRPLLPPGALRLLAALVAEQFVEALAARPDLPQGLAAALRERLVPLSASQQAAREAARSGDRDTLSALLAAGAGISPGRLDAALALRSPRVVAALCWKAGWQPWLGVEVQLALGVAAAQLVRPNAEGGWTLPESELRWQIELLEDLPE